MNSPLRLFALGSAIALSCLLQVGCSPEAKKAKLLSTADQHYQSGDYERAEIEYLNLLKLDQQNAQAISQLGQIYTAQGRTNRAIAFIMRAHELLPNDLDLRLKIGQLHLATGKAIEARAEANFILDRKPQDAEAPLLLVASITKSEEAETLRQRLLSLPAPAPQGAPVLTALATLELRLGQPAKAEALLQQAKAADPKFANQYTVQGSIYISQKNLAAADQAFLEAANLSPARSPHRIQYAQFKLRTGDVAGGAKYLEEIILKTPDYIPALLALADVRVAQNNLPASDTLLEKALSRDPLSLDALILKGRLHNLRNETDKALVLFEKLATDYPRLPIVNQELGRAQAAKGDLNKAIASVAQAVSLAPGSVDAVILLAQLNSRRGDINASVALLRKLTEQRPDLAQPQMMLADAYRLQKNLDGALAIYQQLEQLQPQNSQIPLLRGIVLSQQAKREEARQAFERAFTLSPDSPAALEQLVNLYLQEKKYSEASLRVNAESNKNKKLEGYGQLLLAKIALAENNKELAEASLKQAVELLPDSPTAYFLLAGLYTRTGQQEKALQQLNEVIKRDPKQITAQMLISVLYDQLGNYTAARDGYEKTLAINPRSIVALNNLAYIYTERLKDLDKAQDLAQKARQLAPLDAHTADTLGWIQFRKGQFAWALSLLQEAAEKLSGEAEIQYHLGICQYMMGDEAPARSTLQRALELDSKATWSADARKLLVLLEIDPATITSTAQKEIQAALQERPDDPVALSRLAALQERDGKKELAISSLEGALKANARNVSLLLRLAHLQAASQNSAKALEYAKAARKLAPEDAAVAQSLGRLAYQNGDYSWSAILLQEAARKQPSPELLYDLALATFSVGNLQEARDSLQQALAMAERQALLPFAQSEAAKQMNSMLTLSENPSEALRQAAKVEQVLKANSASVPALLASGTISEQKADFAAARQTYAKILTIYPEFLPAKKRLVALGATVAEFDQRLYDLAQQVRSAVPTDAFVAKTLGIQSYLKGDSARAVSLLKEYVAKQADDADSLYYLGLAQQRQKDPGYTKSLQRALELGLRDKNASEAARKILGEAK